MIRVIMEMVPHGEEDKKFFIGVCEIWNEGTGTLDHGNYRFRISKENPNVNITIGEVKQFPRLTKSGWHLLFECLREFLDKKKTKRKR
jgi:hypothetical protein